MSPGAIGGTAHALTLTNTGRVFVWGINNYGQLGDGSSDESYPYDGMKTSPVEITSYFNLSSGERVKSILIGEEAASYVTTSLGRIFGWGAWYWSRLVQTTPLDITSRLPSSDIVQCAGNQPVYALGENGRFTPALMM